jgi:putative DNA-invertase from lambdoid prophage Rac
VTQNVFDGAVVMRVFGYVRVSTFEQSDNGSSLETQQQQIYGYCMMKGYELTEHFIERGVSGSIPLADRPEGQRLLATVGKGDIIVSSKLDRAFRSAADALTVLEEFKAQGVALHLIDLGGDVTGNGISKMVFTILAAVAEGERDRIRERIRDAKRHLASQGIFSGGSRQFGYDKVEDGAFVRLVPNPTEQAIIKQMQIMKFQGKSLRDIGAATGQPFRSVKRILDRLEVKE